MGSKVFGGLCHSVNSAGARYDVITPAISVEHARVRSSSVDLGALIPDPVCQLISAVAYSALVPNRQDAITGKKGERVSVRVIGAAGTYHSPDTCGIHLGCKLFTAFELDQVVGRQHLRQSSALAIFRVQSNASARQSASTRVGPDFEGAGKRSAATGPIVSPGEELDTDRIRSPNRSTGSSSKMSIAIASEA